MDFSTGLWLLPGSSCCLNSDSLMYPQRWLWRGSRVSQSLTALLNIFISWIVFSPTLTHKDQIELICILELIINWSFYQDRKMLFHAESLVAWNWQQNYFAQVWAAAIHPGDLKSMSKTEPHWAGLNLTRFNPVIQFKLVRLPCTPHFIFCHRNIFFPGRICLERNLTAVSAILVLVETVLNIK